MLAFLTNTRYFNRGKVDLTLFYPDLKMLAILLSTNAEL